MPRPMTETEREAFLAETRVAVGGNVSFFTGTQGRRAHKAELIDRAGVRSTRRAWSPRSSGARTASWCCTRSAPIAG
jgi:hypothetical protein